MSQPNEGPATAAPRQAGAPRPARPLSFAETFICVPLGFLWLAVLAVLAVPVMIYMTLLYYSARGLALLPSGPWRGRRRDADSEERVA